mgnify:CR=1 FL=1
MKTFSELLTEDKGGKNLHLEHLEDEILNYGVNGGRAAINFLQSLRDMLTGTSRSSVNMTVKWDGAPAIFAGIDPEDGKFFVAKKSVFNVSPKLYKTDAEIDADLSGDLNEKFKVALKEFSKLGITGVLQGDLMFTNDVSKQTIEGVSYYTFQPNTIVYAVPTDSDLGKVINKANIGVVWHTTYTGKVLQDMKASFGVNISGLSKPSSVWMDDATYKDTSGKSTFTMRISRWFSWKLSTETIYLGKQRNFAIKLMFKLTSAISKISNKHSHIFHAISHILIAQSKYSSYKSAMKKREKGYLIFSDRYPLKSFDSMKNPMDRPKIEKTIDHDSVLLNFLSNIEKKIYGRIKNPDIILVLDTTLINSLKRKPEHKLIEPIIKEKLKAINIAKKILGKKIIGITCHNSMNLAKKAIKAKADYIAFGAFNQSKTKKTKHVASVEILNKVKKFTKTPTVAIGGINAVNYKNLLLNNANFLAISGYIWKNKKYKPLQAIERLK